MRISMPRGDIKLVRFFINDVNGTSVKINFTDIFFTVKKTSNDPLYLFQKRLSTGGIVKLGLGDYQLKIDSKDTENLAYGKYKFEIQVSYEDQIEETFVGDFVVKEEITYAENELESHYMLYDIHTVNRDNFYTLTLRSPVPTGSTSDYDVLTHKPTINGVELSGDLSLEDLGIITDSSMVPLTTEELDIIISS